MAIQQVNGSVVTKSSTNNNGGSVLNGGSTAELQSVDLGYSNVGVFGSSVIDGTNTDKALSAGTFSYSNQNPVAKRLTNTLSGVNNSYLQSGASVPGNVRSIHKLEVLRTRKLTTAIRAGDWNIYSGQWATEPSVVVDTLVSDDAASPSRNMPGELVYKTGAPVPVQDDYKPKTN
jgi:hypothetical protein